MNKLTRERRAQILSMMVEGVSIRSIARLTGASKNTAYQALLRGAAAAHGAKVLGVEIPEDVARELTSRPRRIGEGAKLDGLYEVGKIEREGDGFFQVILQSSSLPKGVVATARSIFLPDDQIELLLRSLKTGERLHILLNAWKRGGAIVDAEIVRAERSVAEISN